MHDTQQAVTYMRRLLVPTVLIVAAESLTEATQIATGPGAVTGAYRRSSHTATCLTAARLRGGGLSTAGTTVAALVASLGALIALNMAQNGGTSHPPPSCSDAAGLLALTSKADAVALWRASPAGPPLRCSLISPHPRRPRTPADKSRL